MGEEEDDALESNLILDDNIESEDHANHPDAPIQSAGRLEALEAETSRPPTPRFMLEEGAWKRWKWVPYPVRRLFRSAVRWINGPANPVVHTIDPIFPAVQHAPIVLVEKYLPRPRQQLWAVLTFLWGWILSFALVYHFGSMATQIKEWGTPVPIGCGVTYWTSGNGCGLDGNKCRPFSGSGFAFKCPANCASYRVLNPRAVGDQEIVYRPLVIGGPPPNGTDAAVYRGDSFICGAAIHAGIISNTRGGCGVVHVIGKRSHYNGSSRHSIQSVGFDSYFPLSYRFDDGVECRSRDMRWPLLALGVIFTAILSLLTTSPALFFFATFVIAFWTVGLATDPPNITDFLSLFSAEIGKFLPASFTAWVVYDKMGVRRTLCGLTAQVEKTFLWLGGLWVGALTNYTFDFIPIQRLTPHDLQQQPGARTAVLIIAIMLAAAAALQIWFFRQEGRLLNYLKLYALLGGALVVGLMLPDLSLRIHHYILALLLIPGTSLQTRPSLLYQGLLVGLFINGLARWGWDAVLQTSFALQGDARLDSPLPHILAPTISTAATIASISFSWRPSPSAQYDGISVLVNDVERFRAYFEEHDTGNFTWTRNRTTEMNEYFRFAWMQGSGSEDYTKAGKWTEKLEWVPMMAGPSKLRRRNMERLREEREL